MFVVLSALTLLTLICEGKQNFPSFIKVSAFEPPLVNSSDKTLYNGFLSYEVFKLLVERLKFTYSIYPPKDMLFGSNDNGNWTGVVGQVYRKEVDLGAQTLNLNILRYQVVDGTYPLVFDNSKILIPFPKEADTLLIPLQPFTLAVWVCLFVGLVVIGLATKLTLNRQTSWSSCALATLSLFTGQSFCYISNAQTTAVRLVLTGGCLAAVIIINSYTTVLFSIMTIPRFVPLIDSLEDLETSAILPSTTRGSTYEILFKNASEGIYKKIGDRLREHPEALMDKISDQPELVAEKKLAFIFTEKYLDSLIAEDYKEYGHCRLAKAKESFYPLNMGFVVGKESPLRRPFDKQILRMHEHGLINYFDKRFNIHSPCSSSTSRQQSNPAVKPLQLKQFGSIFLFLAAGVCAGLICFIFERYHYI